MRLKREYKIGTPIKFKWYNDDRYQNPNAQFVVKEGNVECNTVLEDVIVHVPQEEAYYCILLNDVINF